MKLPADMRDAGLSASPMARFHIGDAGNSYEKIPHCHLSESCDDPNSPAWARKILEIREIADAMTLEPGLAGLFRWSHESD